MKKYFTLATIAMVAFSANAEINFMNQHESLTAPIKMEKTQIPATLIKKAPAHKQDVDETFEAFLGDFVHSQWALDPETYTDWVASNCGMQISDNGDGTVTMSNFLGFGDIQATYDADDEALYADGQFLFTSQYGSVGVYPFFVNDDDEAEIDYESPMIFMLDDENRFELLNDGVVMILTDGDYAGYRINYLYMFNQFDRVNGTMSWTNNKNEDVTVGVSVENKIENKGYVNVYGFANLGCAMIGVEGDQVQFYNGQGFFFHSNYGLFVNSGVTVTEDGYDLIEADYSGGTYDGNVINLSPFIIYYDNVLCDAYIGAQINLSLDTPTAISNVRTEQYQQVFDLQGRAVSNMQSGQVYFKDNNKVFVK